MDIMELKRKYAHLIVNTGVNLSRGQPLLIRTEIAQREFALLLAGEAYRSGATMVKVDYADPLMSRLRLDGSVMDEYLEYVPSYTENMYRAYIDDGWASISLRGPEYPDIMEGADPERMGIAGKAASRSLRTFLKGISSNRIQWNVCLHPTAAWADKVLDGVPEGEWEDRIWEVLVPILRLDREDPSAAWLEQDAELKRRTRYMNSAGYDQIHFQGPGTDLYVGMASDRVFAGGRCVTVSGREFFPNIPTEEIFSTPDFRRTRGRARTTRPVEVLGSRVNGAWFEFEDGLVTEFGADSGEDVLAQYLDFDEGARALGEVALVDVGSPIYRSGRIFHNILFDENASCHIALGNGYADCVRGGTGMTDEELEKTGCNSSLVHTDFMIGSEEVSVFGIGRDGSRERIIEKGVFVI
mgnify:FL=1